MTKTFSAPDRKREPAVHDIPPISLPQMTTSRLAGGTVLNVYDRCSSPVVQLTIVRDGGLAELQNPAAAGLYARMLREGTASFSAEQIADCLDFNGAWLNTVMMPHHHIIKMYTLCRNLPAVLSAVSEMVSSPIFEVQAFETHRHSLANKMQIWRQKVKYLAQEAILPEAMGAEHPLGRPVLPEDILATTRDELVEIARQWRRSPTAIYLSGQVTDDVIAEVERRFGGMDVSAPSPVRLTPFTPSAPHTFNVPLADNRQCAVNMTFPAIERSHPDYHHLHLAVSALGGYFGSRLMTTVREECGYTYGINAGLIGQIDGAYVSIVTECDPQYVNPLIAEVNRQIELLATNPPEGAELARLKQAVSSALLEVLETPFTIADYHCTTQTQGLSADYFNSRIATLRALTPDDIARTAARYLRPDRATTVIAGNYPRE